MKGYDYDDVTETGYFEYTDREGFKRIGRSEQRWGINYIYGSDQARSREKVGLVDFDTDYNSDPYVDGEPDYDRKDCPHCLQYNVHIRLGPKILMPNEKRPSDYQNWLQCKDCGNIYAAHEIEKQKMLKSDTKLHVDANPFDAKKQIVLGIPKCSTPAGKKASTKRKRERTRPHHKDKEIDALMRIYGDRVTVLQDTDPQLISPDNL